MRELTYVPITTQWDDLEKTIIRNDFNEEWSWGEFIEAMETSAQWIKDVDYEVIIINNIRDSVIPSGNALAIGQSMLKRMPLNLKSLIVVTNPFAALLGKVLKRVAPDLAAKVIMVTTLDDAYERIEKLNVGTELSE